MDNAVVTITTGDLYNKIARITHPFLKKYADRIGADFLVMDNDRQYQLPHYLKLDLHEVLKKYKRVLYIDTDILVRRDAPNIFEVVPETELGIFEEGQFAERAIGMYQFLSEEGVPGNIWNKKYYNTGVMVLSQMHAPLFIQPPKQKDHFKEQTYLNLLIALFGPKIHNLHYKWNRMWMMDKITGEERFDCHFMHYAGLTEVYPEERYLKVMEDDLDVWNRDWNREPRYKYKKNIAVMVEGGLGDQICAEPSVRHIRDKVYQGDNVIIITDYPDVFSHYDLPVHKKGAPVPDNKGFLELHTLRSPEHISWEYMSHPLCHSVDFSSLQSVRLMLPMKDKTQELAFTNLDMADVKKKLGKDLSQYVLLHPGRGWDSKNFPADVWESWLDILLENKFKCVVIGKRISKEQGVVEFNWDKPGCINLIDQQTFGQLTALISQAKVLVSNDSAPIHIAGAFDNWIGLVATCKAPDHVLPYRHSDLYYKAKALERFKLYETFNNQPSQVYGATIDVCTEEQMRECVPLPEEVLRFVKSCFAADLESGGA